MTNKWDTIKREYVKRCGQEHDVSTPERTCLILHKADDELDSTAVAIEALAACVACTAGCSACGAVAVVEHLVAYVIETSLSLIEQLSDAVQTLFIEELDVVMQVRSNVHARLACSQPCNEVPQSLGVQV